VSYATKVIVIKMTIKILAFDEWYEHNFDMLNQEYVDDNPEDFPTDESMQDIENNWAFQEYCEYEYNDYKYSMEKI